MAQNWNLLPSSKAPTSHLYHNNHDGTFTDVTEKAGLTHTGWGQGVCSRRLRQRRLRDIYVTYYGKNVLYPQQRQRNVHRQRKSTLSQAAASLGHRLRFCGLRSATESWDLMVRQLRRLPIGHLLCAGRTAFLMWKGCSPVMCGPRGCRGRKTFVLPQSSARSVLKDYTKAKIDQTNGIYSFSVS